MTENPTNEMVLYQPNDTVELEVRLENETVWLSLNQMTILFDRDKSVISRHIRNVFSEGELQQDSVVAKFATTAADGKTYIVDYYNLDVIISVGYRIKSQRGTEFRIWATKTLRDYVLKGYMINQRFERIENRLTENEKQIAFFLQTALPPKEGVFFEGQIFDAYVFAADLIKSAKKSIILIDNYLDESTLTLLSKRGDKVSAEIVTTQISPQFQLDLDRYNTQYKQINLKISKTFHDRFLIIDGEVYHIGASLKDLGKRLFAFSKIQIKGKDLMKENS